MDDFSNVDPGVSTATPADSQVPDVQGDGQINEPIPEAAPQQVQTVDPAVEGQLKALQAERERRHKAEQEKEFYKQLLQNNQSVAQQQPEYDPDDLPSYKAVDHMIQKRLSGMEQQIRQTNLLQQEAEAKRKYSDFDTVVLLAEEMARSDPGLGPAILAAENPAETAYLIGKSHPTYQTLVQKQATEKVAAQISRNLSAPQTLSNAGGSSVKGAINRWSNASSAEVNQRIAEIKGLR